jgi:hypothetical protein
MHRSHLTPESIGDAFGDMASIFESDIFTLHHMPSFTLKHCFFLIVKHYTHHHHIRFLLTTRPAASGSTRLGHRKGESTTSIDRHETYLVVTPAAEAGEYTIISVAVGGWRANADIHIYSLDARPKGLRSDRSTPSVTPFGTLVDDRTLGVNCFICRTRHAGEAKSGAEADVPHSGDT